MGKEKKYEKTHLEVTMSTQRLADVTDTTSLRPQLNGLEPLDVFAIEEHVPDRRRLLVDLVRVTGEDNTLSGDASRISGEERAGTDEVDALVGSGIDVVGAGGRNAKEEGGGVTEGDGKVGGGNGGVDTVAEEALELVDVVSTSSAVSDSMLREDRVDGEAAETELEDERVLRADRVAVLGVALDGEVEYRVLVLVLEKTEQNEGVERVVFLDESSRNIRETDDDTHTGLCIQKESV
jgi:hypothetical protein